MGMRGGWALHREKAETPVSATRLVMHTNCSHADNSPSFFSLLTLFRGKWPNEMTTWCLITCFLVPFSGSHHYNPCKVCLQIGEVKSICVVVSHRPVYCCSERVSVSMPHYPANCERTLCTVLLGFVLF